MGRPGDCNFNPRTPRGVRPGSLDSMCFWGSFQSTPPARGATSEALQRAWSVVISIHAPREGCDLLPISIFLSLLNFNPRTPRGVRQVHQSCPIHPGHISIHAPREGCDPCRGQGERPVPLFQSTHPARGATVAALDGYAVGGISIHAPREGCDSKLYQRAGSLLGSICLFAQGEEG